MKVAVIMIIETDDFGKKEFKKEQEKLIKDIDPMAKLIDFDMYRVLDDATVETFTRV